MRTLGRLILGGFFLYNGIHHFQKTKDMAGYAATKGVPKPEAAIQLSGAMLILGGAMLALGIKPRMGALMVAGFLAGVSPVMHNFWSIEDPGQKMNEQINFGKNLALLGASLAVAGAEERVAEAEAEAERPKGRGLLRKAA
jgi:putative oxidoreductase